MNLPTTLPNPEENLYYRQLVILSSIVNKNKALLDYYKKNCLIELATKVKPNLKQSEEQLEQHRQMYLNKISKDWEEAINNLSRTAKLEAKLEEDFLSKRALCASCRSTYCSHLINGEIITLEEFIVREQIKDLKLSVQSFFNRQYLHYINFTFPGLPNNRSLLVEYLEKLYGLCKTIN